VFLFLLACTGAEPTAITPPVTTPEPIALRVATFNVSLYGDTAGQIASRLAGDDPQAHRVAAVLQTVRPDIVLINELDADADGSTAQALHDRYLAVPQDDREPLSYPHIHVPASNTGVHSGFDLDDNGQVVATPGSQSYAGDAYGFGLYEGQYGFAVFSRFPIAAVRTFQEFRWTDLPDNAQPVDFYGPDAAAAMRLSSKNHVDLAIDVDGRIVHLLASHPTPPAFDGPEERNKRRNHDEIKLFADYLDGGPEGYHVDDDGTAGALSAGDHFVIVGDLNADPNDGSSFDDAIRQLTEHPLVNDPEPTSDGAEAKAMADGRANGSHDTPAAQDTADFNDNTVGNLRIDYALPSASLTVTGSGVFWPAADDPDAALLDVSDHRAVWVDVEVP
jgi:3-phytase